MNKHILCILPFDDNQQTFLTQTYKNTKFTFKSKENLSKDLVLSANAIIGQIPKEHFGYINHLDLLQLQSSGYNEFLEKGVLSENTVLCNAGDAYGISVAEHLFAMVLSVLKKFPQYRDYQNKSTWTDLGQVMPLHDLNIIVVGLGAIGSTFAKYMHAMGNTIIGIKNNINSKPDFVKEVYTLDKIDELLPKADIIVLTIPVTDDTIGLMNKERFAKMKKTSYFFNVGRGALVDSEALIYALENDLIAGAGVDVTHIEPLPSSDNLWQTKNLFITPHSSGGLHLPETLGKIQDYAMANIEAYINGGEFKNKVK